MIRLRCSPPPAVRQFSDVGCITKEDGQVMRSYQGKAFTGTKYSYRIACAEQTKRMESIDKAIYRIASESAETLTQSCRTTLRSE
jgi:hypothetical protein